MAPSRPLVILNSANFVPFFLEDKFVSLATVIDLAERGIEPVETYPSSLI